MKKNKQLAVFLIVSLLFLVTACGSSAGNVEPTARPYTSSASQAGTSDTTMVTGKAEDGKIVFEQYCSECHDLSEGENIEGPSLFTAGARLDYAYVKESILYPTAHLAHIDGEFEVDDSSMPTDFQEWMSAQQLEDVITYVLSLK